MLLTFAALAPSTRLISSVAFARINSYFAFAIATPVACSVNARCEADAHVLAGCSNRSSHAQCGTLSPVYVISDFLRAVIL